MLKPFSTRIEAETYTALERICEETHIPKSRLISEAIGYVVKKYSNLDKKLELARWVEEAEDDYKAGRTHSIKEVDQMLYRNSKKRRKS